MKICSAEERASMPGLLDTADVAKLRSTEAPSFDRLFVELMTRHHKGAVAMADSQIREGSDPRLRIMAHAIRHGQQGEIALMHGLDGAPAVSLALRNMLADNFNLVPELGAISGRCPSGRCRRRVCSSPLNTFMAAHRIERKRFRMASRRSLRPGVQCTR